jgi:HEAT repeat protein
MPTPTSQEPRPSSGRAPADAFAAIGRGDFAPRDLLPLSDLGRADAAAFAAAWPGFPPDSRERVVRYLADLAESHVEYVFGRALRVALDDRSPVVRQLAVAALWEDDGSDLKDRLIEMLRHDPSQDVRAEAALGLGRFAQQAADGELDAETADRLRAALTTAAGGRNATYVVRRRALGSLAAFGRSEETNRLIREAYDADDAGLKAGSLYAMGQSCDLGWLDTVLHEFDSPDAEMRFEAARASGELGDDRAVPGLANLARDADAEVRQAAIAALGRVGGAAAVNVLRRLAQGAPEADADAIDDALDEALLGVDPPRIRP